jgi:hypothetical protein
MYDAAFFGEHAERYRKLADAFRDCPISDKLATLADEFERKARNLRRQRARAVALHFVSWTGKLMCHDNFPRAGEGREGAKRRRFERQQPLKGAPEGRSWHSTSCLNCDTVARTVPHARHTT